MTDHASRGVLLCRSRSALDKSWPDKRQINRPAMKLRATPASQRARHTTISNGHIPAAFGPIRVDGRGVNDRVGCSNGVLSTYDAIAADAAVVGDQSPSRRRIVMAKQTSKPMPQPTTDADEWLADFGAQIARAPRLSRRSTARRSRSTSKHAASIGRSPRCTCASAPGSGRNSTRSA